MQTQPLLLTTTMGDGATLAQQRCEALVNSIDGIVWEADPVTFRFSLVSAKAERHGHRIALLAIDVHRLAHINGVLGHHVADRLRALMSGTDPCRHIGDECTVALEELDDVQTVAALAERVLAEIGRSSSASRSTC